MTTNILELLEGKWTDGTRPKDVYSLYVSKNPEEYVETIMEGLKSDKRKVQSGCSELASILSENHPELVYPHADFFIKNLTDPKAPVLRWESVCTLGNLAAVDKNKKIPPQISQIAGFLKDKSIVLQGHSVRALAKIAKAFPDNALEVFELLEKSKDNFPGNRIGFVVEAMELLIGNRQLKQKITAFVEPYADSDVKVVAKKALKVLKKIETLT